MEITKILQIVGLFFAFKGAIILAIDTFGKERVYQSICRNYIHFKNQRRNLSFIIVFILSVPVLFFINDWKQLLVDWTIPALMKYPDLSIWLCSVLTLVIIQSLIIGKKQTRILCDYIKTAFHVIRFEFNGKSIQSYKELFVTIRNNMRVILKLFGNIYFYVLMIGSSIGYALTDGIIYWALAITFTITVLIVFILVGIGFLSVRGVLNILDFLIQDNIKKTFDRLAFTGFILLTVGFVFQIIGICIE